MKLKPHTKKVEKVLIDLEGRKHCSPDASEIHLSKLLDTNEKAIADGSSPENEALETINSMHRGITLDS